MAEVCLCPSLLGVLKTAMDSRTPCCYSRNGVDWWLGVLAADYPPEVSDAGRGVKAETMKKRVEDAALIIKTTYWSVTGPLPSPPLPLSPSLPFPPLPSPSLPSHLPPPYPSSSPLPLPPPLPSLPPPLTINSPQMTPLWVLGRIDYFFNLPIILFHESFNISNRKQLIKKSKRNCYFPE